MDTSLVISLNKHYNNNFLQVGNRDDSNVYIRMKLRAATEVGVKAEHIKMDDSTTQYDLSQMVDRLNNDKNVHGIIVQVRNVIY